MPNYIELRAPYGARIQPMHTDIGLAVRVEFGPGQETAIAAWLEQIAGALRQVAAIDLNPREPVPPVVPAPQLYAPNPTAAPIPTGFTPPVTTKPVYGPIAPLRLADLVDNRRAPSRVDNGHAPPVAPPREIPIPNSQASVPSVFVTPDHVAPKDEGPSFTGIMGKSEVTVEGPTDENSKV